jgi:phosphohistidine phosphatase
MMKLFIVRHAKSDWENETLKDVDRPLNQRGYNDAYFVSSFLKEKGIFPDLMVSSPATRAISTCLIFARELNYPEDKVMLAPSIYEAPFTNICNAVRQFPDYVKTAMLFGHNPGLTDFFNEVTNSRIDNLPTCGVLEIHFHSDRWNTVFDKQGKLFGYLSPKEIKS